MNELSRTAKDWYNKGKALKVPGTASTRIWQEGKGDPVVLLHGVPASSYLYRKLIPELAVRNFKAIAIDFPGLGFADRPDQFDYSWTGLSEWLELAVNAAGIEKFHLVIHDIGGPIGMDLIRRNPSRIMSLTILNTIVNPAEFSKPWVMRPFSWPIIGKLWTRSMNSPMVVPLFRWKGVDSTLSYDELRVYGELLTLGDGGDGFFKIMNGFEQTKEFQERIHKSFQNRNFAAQIIWSAGDKDLTIEKSGEKARLLLNDGSLPQPVKGKHFLQEDSFEVIAKKIAELARPLKGSLS